jgi:hypothetical protein
MNLHHPATHLPSSHERHHEADTRLYGRWQLIARGTWLSIVILMLAIFVFLLPSYFAQLKKVCSDPTCALVQPTLDTVQAIHQLGLSVSDYATFIFVLTIVTAVICFFVSGVIFWRKSDDWMALLVALTEVASGTLFVTYALLESPSSWRWLAIVSNVFGHAVLFLFASLFPNGKFIPRWSRWIPIGWIIWSLLFYTVLHSLPFAFNMLALLIGSACAMYAQIYRYRYASNLTQRQQIKWVVLAGCVATVMVIVLDVPNLIFPVTGQIGSFYRLFVSGPADILAVLLLALSLALAILRYRLYDIDIIINRTLVYGTLTILLALFYFGLIFVLQFLLWGIINQNNDVAIVVSTLAIAAIFQPLRHRIQAIIDRRFYRRKYDATKVVEAFSATLRNEIDLNQLREHLLTVVQDTMQPAHISLWLRPPTHKGTHWVPWRDNPPVTSEQEERDER